MTSIVTPKIIAITGSDGSGKSTLCGRLKQRLLSQGESVVSVSIWDSLTVHHSFLKLSPSQIDQYLFELSIPARTHFLMHAINESLALGLLQKPSYLLLDGYWYKYLASEAARINLSGNAIKFNPKELASQLPLPHQIFWVDADLEICAARKSQFSRFETNSKTPSSSTFLQFQSHVLKTHAAWVKESSSITLCGSLSPEALEEECFRLLLK